MTFTSVKAMRDVRHDGTSSFRCGRCGAVKPAGEPGGITCGYGYGLDGPGWGVDSPICFACCGELDRERMKTDGRATLYLSDPSCAVGRPRGTCPVYTREGNVSNWPGSLSFPVLYLKHGRHNIARVRTDCWFNGPDGFIWHGYSIGDYTQIAHCRRTRKKIGEPV